jgi:hypothetical protein
MMNEQLTDKDILDFLMTSDFNENLTPEESKFLLFKFRYFYRLQHSKMEGLNNVIIDLEEKVKNADLNFKNTTFDLQSEIVTLKGEKEKIINRKLTWKERLSGKINKEK